ncbi:MAG: alpha-mannosidase [Candidatus Hodarchaeota archaeon]
MAPRKPRYKIGKYSGMERMDPSTLEEPDKDDAWVRQDWFEEERHEPEFKKYIDNRIDYFKTKVNLDLDNLDVILIGHSHIDVCWKWRYEQTRKKAIVTFNKACEMAEKYYPGKYTYHQSQAQLFEWIEEDDPELFERIKKQVKAGNFNIVGGCWVEPDCMMPSGEAFVRQRLYGMHYFQDKFGIMPETAWMMDSFGYGRNLPQIFTKSGAKHFWTTKITWNRKTTFPFVNYWWQSPDGTRIITHGPKHSWGTLDSFWMFEIGRHPVLKGQEYIGDYTRNYDDIADFVEEDEFCPTIGVFYGAGDGGHGPTSQEVAEAVALEEKGAARIGTAKELFSVLEEWSDRFPVWNDELYLEYHRGTFTTHSRVKRNNRRLECKASSVEMLCTLVSAMNDGFAYPKDAIDTTWKAILKNQFHDALPGSSIPEAYDDLYEDWEYCDELLDGCVEAASRFLKFKNGKQLLIFNPNADGKARIFIPASALPGIKLDGDGVPPRAVIITPSKEGFLAPMQPVAAEPDEWLEAKPAGWWTILPLTGMSIESMNVVIDDEASIKDAFTTSIKVSTGAPATLDNGILHVEIDPKTGAIDKITSKLVAGIDNVFEKPSNLPIAFLDDHPGDQAWNIRNTIDPEYDTLARDYKRDENVRISITKEGPVVSEITVERQFGPQPVTQKIALYKGLPEVYCEFLTDWKEPTTLVKIAFSPATDSEIVESDNQYCTIQRKTRPEAPADKARWEKIQHKFSDMHSSDVSWGVAFLNDGKYSFDTLDGRSFRLTVLKCANYPTAAGEAWVNEERKMNLEKHGKKQPQHTDMGQHRTRYAIYPHAGITRKDASGKPSVDVKEKADFFNYSPLILHARCKNCVDPGRDNPLIDAQLVASTNPTTMIKSLKLAEKEPNTLVLRMVEYSGNDSDTELVIAEPFSKRIKEIHESDLLERKLGDALPWKPGDSLKLNLGKWEIKTFLLKLG